MAGAYVQTASIANASSPASLSSGAFSSNPTVNNILVVFTWGSMNSSTALPSGNLTCSDNIGGNTYTQTAFQSTGFDGYTAMFYCVVAATGASFAPKITLTGGLVAGAAICAAEFSGNATSSVLDNNTTSGYVYNNQTSPASMTIVAGDIVCGLGMSTIGTNATPSNPTGWTQIAANTTIGGGGVGSACYILAPASPVAPTWTFTANPNYNASCQAGFKISSGSRGLFRPATLALGAGGSFFQSGVSARDRVDNWVRKGGLILPRKKSILVPHMG